MFNYSFNIQNLNLYRKNCNEQNGKYILQKTIKWRKRYKSEKKKHKVKKSLRMNLYTRMWSYICKF